MTSLRTHSSLIATLAFLSLALPACSGGGYSDVEQRLVPYDITVLEPTDPSSDLTDPNDPSSDPTAPNDPTMLPISKNTCEKPLSCNGTDTPTCGSWEFDSGTEGWNPVFVGDPEFDVISDQLSTENGALVIPIDGSQTGSGRPRIELDLCPNMAFTTNSSKKIEVTVRYEPAPGYEAEEFTSEYTSEITFELEHENNLRFIDVQTVESPTTMTTLTSFESDELEASTLRLTFTLHNEWKGRILVDSIKLL